MLTSLLIGAIAPHSPKTKILSDDHSLAAQYAVDHLDDVRAIEVDVCHQAVGGVDTVGSAIWLGPNELAELDGIVEDRSVPFAKTDDDSIDFATILRASRVDTSHGIPLYLEAHEEDGDMSLSGAFIKGGGGFAPTVGGGMIDMFRVQDPSNVDFRVDAYVL